MQLGDFVRGDRDDFAATQRVFLQQLNHRFVRENFTEPPTVAE